ncbi:Protein of unknown function [Pyronema omphalodes CBS 100304]|uniref:Uncharacterized protein n=1 Tax=Pyronema omphalodes (strain CBS 100304) TaxID=1076935 RepID=U4L3F8_PYROM|nr:Protein of unknown function [Pyronema omphalodes CBS 100304]
MSTPTTYGHTRTASTTPRQRPPKPPKPQRLSKPKFTPPSHLRIRQLRLQSLEPIHSPTKIPTMLLFPPPTVPVSKPLRDLLVQSRLLTVRFPAALGKGWQISTRSKMLQQVKEHLEREERIQGRTKWGRADHYEKEVTRRMFMYDQTRCRQIREMWERVVKSRVVVVEGRPLGMPVEIRPIGGLVGV